MRPGRRRGHRGERWSPYRALAGVRFTVTVTAIALTPRPLQESQPQPLATSRPPAYMRAGHSAQATARPHPPRWIPEEARPGAERPSGHRGAPPSEAGPHPRPASAPAGSGGSPPGQDGRGRPGVTSTRQPGARPRAVLSWPGRTLATGPLAPAGQEVRTPHPLAGLTCPGRRPGSRDASARRWCPRIAPCATCSTV
jgi:hypothetical protein